SSEELGNCLQTPTLIGCIFLTISLQPPDFRLSLRLAVISEAFDYDTVFSYRSKFLKNFSTC
ncbi:MAG: hypothetical protein WA174_10620, partial [Rhodoferax sp.]